MNATQEQMNKMFSKLQNHRDWKAPIKRFVRESELELALAAIEFFTATKGTVQYWNEYNGEKFAYVTAPGYRLGPAGDH